MTDTDQAKSLWHGCSENRWHDKSMQVVVTGDGEISGIIGEHSMADGMPTVGFCHHLQARTDTTSCGISDTSAENLPSPELIFEESYASLRSTEQQEIQRMVRDSEANFSSKTQDYTMEVLRYEKLGKETIKKAGLAPDAVVQMAMQLASCRVFSQPAVSTYEAVQTRLFRHGRTETARSASTASANMCQSLSWKSLQEACDTHTAYTRQAVEGKGCDRHFLGLEYLLETGEARPQLFDDPVFLRSKRWLISTSTVPTLSPGFGPPDGGYGIGYDIRKDHLVFTVSARRSENSVELYCMSLVEALDDIRDLFPCSTTPSKL